MLKLKIFFIRAIKGLLLKVGLFRVVGIFEGVLEKIVYMSKLSRWCKEHEVLPFNDFYNKNVKYEDRFKLHEFIYTGEKLNGPIDFYEFGVAEGTSFQWWRKRNQNTESRFFGFDTFTGLPEDFGVMKKDDYNTNGEFPDTEGDKRCTFVSGLFQDSLPSFLKNHTFKNRKVIHLDADLYSATLYVLTQLYPFLSLDDIILFDEFAVPMHEFKAFVEFESSFYFKYKVLGAVNNYLQLAIKVV